MPRILDELIANPPSVFVGQTRGTLILRDLARLMELSRRSSLRVSFSVTTNREDIRKIYEPHCAPIDERIDAIRRLREAGVDTFVTLAPLLPCDPELLAKPAPRAGEPDMLGETLPVRPARQAGAAPLR